MTDKALQAQREHCEDLLSPPEPDRQQRDKQTHAERNRNTHPADEGQSTPEVHLLLSSEIH